MQFLLLFVYANFHFSTLQPRTLPAPCRFNESTHEARTRRIPQLLASAARHRVTHAECSVQLRRHYRTTHRPIEEPRPTRHTTSTRTIRDEWDSRTLFASVPLSRELSCAAGERCPLISAFDWIGGNTFAILALIKSFQYSCVVSTCPRCSFFRLTTLFCTALYLVSTRPVLCCANRVKHRGFWANPDF